MKAISVFFVVVFLGIIFSSTAIAQKEFTIQSVGAGLGKGALASGYDISIGFKKDGNTFKIVGNHTRMYVRYQWTEIGASWIDAGVTAGFYKNAPWAGVQVITKPTSFLSTCHWYGGIAGAPDRPDWKPNEFFNYHSATLSAYGFDVTYALMSFLGDKRWGQFPDIMYTFSVNETWKCSIDAGYDVNAGIPLYQFMWKHTF